jgi:hypothetical protein
MVSFAVMNSLMLERCEIAPELVLNMDSTQYQTSGDSQKKRKVKYQGRRGKKTLKASPPKKGEGLTAFFVKHYLMISAAGDQSDPVFVLEDKKMAADKIDVYRVAGLGTSTSVGSVGYVVFCSSRLGNDAFFKWYHSTVLVDFVNNIRTAYNLDKSIPAWYQLDGEACQLKFFTDKDFLKKLEQLNVVVGKPPASTTSTSQPCDVGNCFRSSKTLNRGLKDNDFAKHPLISKLDSEVINKHLQKFHQGKNDAIKANKRKQMKLSLLRTQFAIQNTMKKTTIHESFSKAGVYPFKRRNIYEKVTTKMSKEDVTVVDEKFEELVDMMRDQGEISEADFDRVGIAVDPSGTKKRSSVSRARSCILTNLAFVANEEQKAAAKTEAKKPAGKKQLQRRKPRKIPLEPSGKGLNLMMRMMKRCSQTRKRSGASPKAAHHRRNATSRSKSTLLRTPVHPESAPLMSCSRRMQKRSWCTSHDLLQSGQEELSMTFFHQPQLHHLRPTAPLPHLRIKTRCQIRPNQARSKRRRHRSSRGSKFLVSSDFMSWLVSNALDA